MYVPKSIILISPAINFISPDKYRKDNKQQLNVENNFYILHIGKKDNILIICNL